jgi:hypothetical protein
MECDTSPYYALYGFSNKHISKLYGNGSVHTYEEGGATHVVRVRNILISSGKRPCEYCMAVTLNKYITEAQASQIFQGFYVCEVAIQSRSASELIAHIMSSSGVSGMFCRDMADTDDIFDVLVTRISKSVRKIDDKMNILQDTHWIKKHYTQIVSIYKNGLKNKIRREPHKVVEYIDNFDKYMCANGVN